MKDLMENKILREYLIMHCNNDKRYNVMFEKVHTLHKYQFISFS